MTLTRHDDHLLLRFRKDVSFLAKPALVRLLAEVPNNTTLIIDAERADRIGPDIGHAIEDFAADAPARGIAIDRFRWPQRPERGRPGANVRGFALPARPLLLLSRRKVAHRSRGNGAWGSIRLRCACPAGGLPADDRGRPTERCAS